jgi:hypothetical protein
MTKQIIYNFFGRNFDRDFENWFKSKVNFDFKSKLENQKFFSLKQIHSDKIFYLDSYSKLSFSALEEGDAIVSNLEEVFLCVKTADCVPILIFDENSKTIAAIHSGHGGSFLEITKKTIIKFSEKIKNFDPANLKVFIAPYIFCENYEVGPKFFEKWIKKDSRNAKYFYPHLKILSKYIFDNYACIFDQLIDSGILKENIENSKINTFTDKNFYSYRGGCLDNQRNIAIIGIF